DRAQSEAINDRLQVFQLAGTGVVQVADAGGLAVTALVDRDHAELTRQVRRGVVPDLGGLGVAVEQDQRVLGTGVAPLSVVEAEAVRLNELVASLARTGHQTASAGVVQAPGRPDRGSPRSLCLGNL